MTLQRIARDLVAEIRDLRFGRPVTHVYNPLEYARRPHETYLTRYGCGQPEVVLVGMNPGPWGMVQTGVPFGEVSHVRDWLGISDPVGRPPDEHPKRPVLGWACPRREVSGARLWGWAQATFGQPARFFERFFVTNYCPLAFLEATGRNRTPDKLPVAERMPLLAACDRALRRTVERLQPRLVIGVGAFAETRARAALADLDVTVGRILHPSPANPRANKGWARVVRAELAAMAVRLPKAG
ncbi:MAG: single-stranded DNA-binding protein [Planctomycetes bacterium]|nr:single-stranded DNA-binding protein [Planctomycetota bacterium]